MTRTLPQPRQVLFFRDLLANRLGLALASESPNTLLELLAARVRRRNLCADLYLAGLKDDSVELRELARVLTVTETYFFRHLEQLLAYSQRALLERSRARPALPVRIVSVGCASGEEPYSLAALALSAGVAKERLQVLGLDMNPDALEKARRGRYTEWSLRETPLDFRERWFRQLGRDVTLCPELTESVQFAEANLADPHSLFWSRESYDIIFCRNLLMYLTPDAASAALERLHDALAVGGYLFLGHAENLRGFWLEKFELQSLHNSFFYRKRDGTSVPDPTAKRMRASAEETAPTARHMISDSGPTPSLLEQPKTPSSHSLCEVRRLIEIENYRQAHNLLCDPAENLRAEPEADLLLAITLVQLGKFEMAEKICNDSLEKSAGSHYLLGLCEEGRLELDKAVHQHRKSAKLDPTFAMPRVQLALLAQRGGETLVARQEFETALQLLHHERPERLRLFAAGFRREGLLQLCREQLTSLTDVTGEGP